MSMICPNCGASVEEHLSKCPYCGTMNFAGAEKEYLNELDDLKEDLDDLNDVPDETVKKELKHAVSRTGKRVLFFGVLIFLLVGFSVCKNIYDDHQSVKNSKLLMEWQLTAFPKLDALYAAEDYDGICEFLNEAYEENNIYHANNWKHMAFISAYQSYKNMQEDAIAGLDRLQIYDAVGLLFFRPFGQKLSAKEQELIESYQKEAAAYLYEVKGFTEEEVETIYKTGDLP